MSAVSVLLLGVAVGGAVLVGLTWRWILFNISRPVAVLRGVRAGILAFLLWDLLTTAYRPLDDVVARLRDGQDDATPVWQDSAAFATGLLLGFVVLVSLWMRSRPAALARRPGRMVFVVALGCGWAGLCAGLAVGASAVSGSLWLTVLLVLGWAALNVFEGAAILVPYANNACPRPGPGRVASLAGIAALPAVVGALLGELAQDDASTVACLSLAAGAAAGLLLRSSALTSPIPFERHGGAFGYTGALVTVLTLIVGFVASMLVTLGGVGA